MSLRVILNGITVECDSTDEAVALVERLGAKKNVSAPSVLVPVAVAPSIVTYDAAWSKFMMLIASAGPKQLNVLKAIKAAKTIELGALAKAVGADNTTAISGVLSGISKNVKKAGLSLEDVIDKEVVGYGADRRTTYFARRVLIHENLT